MRILLVDDEQELVSALAERLSFRGFEADWAVCGLDALKMVVNKDYDLAVLDVKMPRMSGLELKKRIEAQKPGMKFIFLSGHGAEESFQEGVAAGGHYLVKPIRIEDLVAKIKEILS